MDNRRDNNTLNKQVQKMSNDQPNWLELIIIAIAILAAVVFFLFKSPSSDNNVEQSSVGLIPCNERIAGAVSRDSEGVACESDNLCKVIQTSSCDVCHDVIWLCVER